MPAAEAASSADLSRELKTLAPLVEPLAARIEDLRAEAAVLPRYIEPLRRLLPLVPELAELDESEIRGSAAPGGRARPQHRGRDDRRRSARGSPDRPRRSLRAGGGPGRLRRDRLRDRDSPERGRGGASRPRPRTRPPPSLAASLRESLVPGRSQRRWRAGCARFPPSSTGRRRSCTRCCAARGGVASGAPATPRRHRTARSRGAGRGDESRVRHRRLDTERTCARAAPRARTRRRRRSSCSTSSRRRSRSSRRC